MNKTELAQGTIDASKIIVNCQRQINEEDTFANFVIDVFSGFKRTRAFWQLSRIFIYLANQTNELLGVRQ